jgi:branched-chain amino acid transport system permease protein
MTPSTPLLARKSTQIALLLATFVGLLAVPMLSSGSGTEFTADILIYAIMAVGLYVQLALLGLVNFGFSAFFGLGAYLGANFLMRVSPDLLTSLALTVLASAAAATLIGLIALKTKNVAFTMITLTFSQLLYVLAVADDRWTGGVNGLTGVPRPKLPAFLSELGLTLGTDAGFYYFCLVAFLVTVFLVWVLQRSRLGSVMVGIRENEERMVVLGYPVFAYKLLGFVISGVIGGYAGYMNAMLLGYVGPGALFWTMSGEALLMVILGGTASLAGPIVGASVFIGISHYAVTLTDHWRLFVGLAFIGIVLFAPQGLVKIVGDRIHRRARDTTPASREVTP